MNTPQFIASRIATEAMQERFASLSGDRNPMHMDALAARRTQAGLRVVHGVHTLLWALESLAASGRIVSSLIRIRVKFLKWVYLGDEAMLKIPAGQTSDPSQLQVEVLGMPVLSAELSYGLCESIPPGIAFAVSPAAPRTAARDLSFAELKDLSGDSFTPRPEDAAQLFPHLAAVIGEAAVAEMAACSYVVGMEAPGLHSMFSKMDITLARRATDPEPDGTWTALHFAVSYHDERFSKARIAVNGQALSGVLEVFMRDRPVQQAAIDEVAKHVDPTEFSGMHALVIGGSRGLGELTAKLIVAGGGRCTITYARGKEEAERIAQQVHASGRGIEILPYDVLLAPNVQIPQQEEAFTHLYYFATNAIFRPKGDLVSRPILNDFVAFYIQGFHDLCLELTRHVTGDGRKLVAYYPSSIAVEERPIGMTEYAMVKAAGEQMCRDMNAFMPGLHILTTRLPRLPTDQTAGVVPERAADPLSVMLPIVREMQQLSSAG